MACLTVLCPQDLRLGPAWGHVPVLKASVCFLVGQCGRRVATRTVASDLVQIGCTSPTT